MPFQRILCQVISLRPIILSNTHQARSKEPEEGRESTWNFVCQHKEQQIKERIYYANLLVSKVHYNFVHITVMISILYMIVMMYFWCQLLEAARKAHHHNYADIITIMCFWCKYPANCVSENENITIMWTWLQLCASDTSKPPNGLHTSKIKIAIISHT